MRPSGPTFWFLDSVTGWRQEAAEGVVPDPEDGLRLDVDPEGPLALDAEDGSLGRLVLPRGVAVGVCGAVYLLDLGEARILRFDAGSGAFEPLPEPSLEGIPRGALAERGNLAAAGGDLYLANPLEAYVTVVETGPLRPRRRLALTGGASEGAAPVDVTEHGGDAYVLDEEGGVHRRRPGAAAFERLFFAPGAWRRLALDRDGRFYLLDAEKARLHVFDAAGRSLGEAGDSEAIRGRFAPPPLQLDDHGRLSLSGVPGPLFTRDGRLATAGYAEAPGRPSYRKRGVWWSEALDSEIHRCEWHRVELELRSLPAGSEVRLATYCDAERYPTAEISRLPDHLWRSVLVAKGPMQPADGTAAVSHLLHDGLIQNREGRYLWLRLELHGDGYSSPGIRSLRVHYPRRTYLDDLPAVFSSDQDSRFFLNRFLAVFHSEWQRLDEVIDTLDRYFDPRTVPGGPFLDYLAGWLGQRLEAQWDEEQKRRLLAALPAILPRRGTAEGLRRFLAVYLANLSGMEPEAQGAFPRLVEGFRERQALVVASSARGELGSRPLWSPRRTARAQLGTTARVGTSRLVSTGQPRLDPFHATAYRFRIFVPAAWVTTAAGERLLRHAVESEKPAHTRYELCLVEPRLRVGRQATVGIDTLIGAVPAARLDAPEDPEPAPSRAPRHRLGYDSVLGAAPRPVPAETRLAKGGNP